MPKPLRILLFGAGNRAADAYGQFGLKHPMLVKFMAVAEPDPIRREPFAILIMLVVNESVDPHSASHSAPLRG